MRRYRKRVHYLQRAIPSGFHKELLILDGSVVGQIEYAPAEVSYYPIEGQEVIVMNCIWVLRKVKGRRLGMQLLEEMVYDESGATGFATLALENHWSPWFQRGQIEWLGFKSIDSISVTRKVKSRDQIFKIHLMWMPAKRGAPSPKWNKQKLLEGVTSCTAHPLYHPQTFSDREIFHESLHAA